MKKFNFSLQKVLQHRKVLENIAQSDLMNAQAKLNAELQKLEQFKEAKRNAFRNRYEVQIQEGFQVAEAAQLDEYIQGQDLRIKIQEKKVQEEEKLVEEKREILRKAAQEVKIIEKLREKKREEFIHEFNRLDQAEIDENTVLRFKIADEDGP